MNNPEYRSKIRDKEIAENEATRTLFSDVRASTWVVIVCGLAALAVAFIYLTL
jgi:LPS O-antigen subunit length determinant protein (WzzB/FepE family)